MNNERLYILMACWALSVGVQLIFPPILFFVQISIILVVLFIMTGFRTSFNFFILLTTILVYGFALTIYAFNQQIHDQGQYQYILAHVLLTISLLLSWLMIHDLNSLKQKLQELQVRLQLLEKYDAQTKALSLQEFKERGLLIETGMRRRGEKGQLLLFTMKKDIPLAVQASLRQEFIKACLQTVRSKFDLVTSPTEESVFIFLQGTDEMGRKIVINRIIKTMKENINFLSLPYHIEMYETENLKETLDSLLREREISL
ncbi:MULTISPECIES: hypothetical protein [unclassified Virgibacillus]|uniref:hypothetical protein n=1 Tax=unclassified Virgibacillus TaxID=2620237 RepID=UPI00090AC1DA|nr:MULTISPECIES: hypothetical protein [unclassified Virgibacillus]API93148.1 hypothetical protein BKP57_15840 [Virgibacillus sp. 6R]MBS7428810.1 hypothetical protein [Virgibacillus sp. 19R1-5]